VPTYDDFDLPDAKSHPTSQPPHASRSAHQQPAFGAKITRPDGVEIAFETHGEGPAVVLASYWSGHPTVFSALTEDLSADHRFVTYDARGTGRSTRRGPYDMETDSADLAAVVETAGSPAVMITIADGANRAVRIAARHPELVRAVITLGTSPLAIDSFRGKEGMIGSETVVGAFLDVVERDYRGAMRALLGATNAQMSEEELRDRVAFQVDYCPREAAVGRLNAWAQDDPEEAARATGGRLFVLTSSDVAGPWLPPFEELRATMRRILPDARIEEVADGAVSRPDLTAAVVRQITGVGAERSQ
jgi:pimeloyl-ACP methyl ester carboxylesterase